MPSQVIKDTQNNTSAIATVSPTFKTLIDEVDANTTYVGYAKLGTATSAASWKILKISVSGTVTTTTYADGDDLFNNIWDDRASLSYS